MTDKDKLQAKIDEINTQLCRKGEQLRQLREMRNIADEIEQPGDSEHSTCNRLRRIALEVAKLIEFK